tara:strand:+ start:367 stop:693 length:327 start_codon:yes stop_codon:yes gene_type:complete
MVLDWLIPGCISDATPHHCESTPCYDSKEQKINSYEPNIHIRYSFVTCLNIVDWVGFLLGDLNTRKDDERTLVLGASASTTLQKAKVVEYRFLISDQEDSSPALAKAF